MKRIITIPVIAMFMVCILFPASIIAGNEATHTVNVQKKPKEPFEHNMRLDEEGRRTPPAPLCCVISETAGLHISGLSEDIITYEIWDATSETIIASFSAESDFIDFLFCQTGVVMIRLETESYYLVGYIEI